MFMIVLTHVVRQIRHSAPPLPCALFREGPNVGTIRKLYTEFPNFSSRWKCVRKRGVIRTDAEPFCSKGAGFVFLFLSFLFPRTHIPAQRIKTIAQSQWRNHDSANTR